MYLKVFQSCFPVTQKSNFFRCKPWTTQGIKNSCATKKNYQNLKYNKDPGLKLHYL